MALVHTFAAPARERINNRAPTSLGEHPYVVHERNIPTRAENAYQYRGDISPTGMNPLAQKLAGIPSEEPHWHKWAALILAATGVGLAAYAVMQRKQEVASAPAPSTGPVIVMPSPTAPTGALLPAAVLPSEPAKRPRRRRTTQARSPDGHFLPAGTLAAPKTEGK